MHLLLFPVLIWPFFTRFTVKKYCWVQIHIFRSNTNTTQHIPNKITNKYVAFPDNYKYFFQFKYIAICYSNTIQIHVVYDFTTHWRKPGFFCASSGQVTAEMFEAHSQSKPAFMSVGCDKPYWLPSHPFLLRSDQQLQCRPIFSVLPAHL